MNNVLNEPRAQTLHPFKELAAQFETQFRPYAFPAEPANLYGSLEYTLAVSGKRVRPILCLMGNEVMGSLQPDAFLAGNAVELFHTFSLVHDDIMDRSALRRGQPTLYMKYGTNTAILAGDILLIHAYMQLGRLKEAYRGQILDLFSGMACQICEGQQMDIDFESREIEAVSYEDYLLMITLKTSVLLGAAVQMGAIIGGADMVQQQHLHEFGKNTGIAFQIQDDLLDVFGDTARTGKQVGSDILDHKKTALLLKAFELGNATQKAALKTAMMLPDKERIQAVTQLYKELEVDRWAREAIAHYTSLAFRSLEQVAVPASRKETLVGLAHALLVRES